MGCNSNTAAAQLVDELYARGFPFGELGIYPISTLEGVGGEVNGVGRAVCAVGCLACCADALRPGEATGSTALLTPDLLGRTLMLFHELRLRGSHVLSTHRLNLFGGSNELDQPYCVQLRELLSAYLEETYGFPLGYTSSDIAFHISGSRNFKSNIEGTLDRSRTWDNICFSIDEQVPLSREKDYQRYLENLSWVWDKLASALDGRQPHAKPLREGEPRVILNLLIPAEGDYFKREFTEIYPGGPIRATSFDELIDRYVRPFAGSLQILNRVVPEGHYFTTAVGRLGGKSARLVYVAESRYSLTGRAHEFIQASGKAKHVEACAVRTKLVPIGGAAIQIRARFATTPVSEDELGGETPPEPEWFRRMNLFRLNLSEIEAWRPSELSGELPIASLGRSST